MFYLLIRHGCAPIHHYANVPTSSFGVSLWTDLMLVADDGDVEMATMVFTWGVKNYKKLYTNYGYLWKLRFVYGRKWGLSYHSHIDRSRDLVDTVLSVCVYWRMMMMMIKTMMSNGKDDNEVCLWFLAFYEWNKQKENNLHNRHTYIP